MYHSSLSIAPFPASNWNDPSNTVQHSHKISYEASSFQHGAPSHRPTVTEADIDRLLYLGRQGLLQNYVSNDPSVWDNPSSKNIHISKSFWNTNADSGTGVPPV